MADLKPLRTYKTRASQFIKLKTDTDEVITVNYVNSADNCSILAITHGGYGLRFYLDEVPVSGSKAVGVKCMDLRDDFLISVNLVHDENQVGILTNRGAFKRMKVEEIPVTSRARRGVQILRELKRNPHRVTATAILAEQTELIVGTMNGELISINPNDYPLSNRYSNGSFIIDTETQG